MNVTHTLPVDHPRPALILRATSAADRWVVVMTALLIGALVWQSVTRPAGQRAVVHRDNQPVLTLSLGKDQKTHVEGRLGTVAIHVEEGRIRLLEYASSRMIGTRSGWISTSGAILACVPCGIMIQVEGEKKGADSAEKDAFDGIAR